VSKLKTLFGFDVEVEEFARRVRDPLFPSEAEWQSFLQRLNSYNANEYSLYLHAIVIHSVERSKFGLPGGMAARLGRLELKLSINEKQRLHDRRSAEGPRMEFLNHMLDTPAIGADAKLVHPEYLPFEISASIPANFFVERPSFRLYAIVFVSRAVPPRDRKLTAMVRPYPTEGFAEHLRREYGDPTKRMTPLRHPVTLQDLRPLEQVQPTQPAAEAAAALQRKDPPVAGSKSRTQVFVSYSHQDAEWLNRLQVHLKPLVRQGTLDLWDDSKIQPGAAWRDEIEAALTRASVAVLLVSADFLASDYVADKELPPLLDRAANGGVRILSVIVGPCLFQSDSELSKYQAVNSPDMPLSKMSPNEAEETLVKLAQAIAKSIGS
jgi:hypothetical protein